MTDPRSDGPDVRPPSPLSIPLFRAVWLTTLVANFGILVQTVGASWLMTELDPSPVMVAAIQTASALPIFLLSLPAGAIADNLEKRRVIMLAQAIVLVSALALSTLAWLHLMGPWLLIALTALVGCGTALNGPSWQASVGDMVPRSILPRAVALNSMGFNLARSLGPAIGGALVAWVGAAGAFVFNAASTVGLIWTMRRWNGGPRASRLPRERLGTAMAAGLRYVAMSPPILSVAVRAALFAAAVGAIPALLPLIARRSTTGGALGYGVLLGAFGTGAVIGALSNGRLRNRCSNEACIRIASLALALCGGGLGWAGSLFHAVPFLLIGGFGWVTGFSNFNIVVQLNSPRWVLGRALSIYQTAVFGGLALGSWTAGKVAQAAGLERGLTGSALALLAVAALGRRWRMPETTGAGLDPQRLWREPTLAVPVEQRSGPIVISIEHRIVEACEIDFLTAMHNRRRIRRRDGARHWTLLRDLGDANLWIERYSVPTWLDYVRHIERRTVADEVNDREIRATWLPGYAPVVHRRIERQVGSWSDPSRSVGTSP